MNSSSLLTPSSSSSSPHHLQSHATFDHDDFLQNIFASSAPWPSSVLDDDAPPPTSDSPVGTFHHHDVDSRNQITMIPLSHHNPNDTVDVNALYNGFSAGSLPFHFPQGSGGGVMKQSHTQTHSQATASTTTGGTAVTTQTTKPKVRARRGQATDPHSIAERLRRERIAERMKSLQELVPNGNKTDKASMLDEIIDYVKFLQLQVKVLSMSRLGGAAASVSSHEDAGGSNENTSDENHTTAKMTEHQVAKLMEEDMGSAMQYLQGKGLCLMPISLATTISTATCPSRNNPLISAVKEAGVPLSPNAATTSVVNGNGASLVNVKDASSVSKP
ncbi:unnamed protein product [Eruca vesicaria subsp. sativa]|uniref:BHLH domain-containing protein n=1 Tax=Eruca vesicaria subsp. sativa TaxID=29727 RepID=A0ABC8K2U4_ERUVS|nr:unnamed protein product [Eruca vesicaria subsp. sativa]